MKISTSLPKNAKNGGTGMILFKPIHFRQKRSLHLLVAESGAGAGPRDQLVHE